MPLGDLYELDLEGDLLGQETHNIFYFASVSGNPTAEDLALNFWSEKMAAIGAISTEDLTYVQMRVKNLDTATDFYTLALNDSGERASQTAGTFDAWGFKYHTNNPHFKAGAKRFAGVYGPDVVDGFPTATQLVRLENLAVILGNIVTSANGNFRPRIISERCVKDPITHKCTDAPKVVYRVIINNVTFDWYTSQGSRKME